ncbi:MAG TPA: hypothetical protein VH206_22795 [Xanthobacteraceae bacterium]|jgi:hypothetical protein|nr:hypothetical protein [Xanthobacteraceae bacterium]
MLGVETDIAQSMLAQSTLAQSALASSAVRLWIAAGAAALLVFVCALAVRWAPTRTVGRVGITVGGACLGAILAWAFLAGTSNGDVGAERRALQIRATGLNAQALASGSPLACLDGFAGETVEAACEKALFATPANVAAATSYTAARLTLLADLAAYNQNNGAALDGLLAPLQRALEADRFGFVAHALAARDGCTSENCRTLSLLRNPGRVRANLSGQTLDHYLDHYATIWSADVPVADASSAQPAAGQVGTAGRKVVVDIDFPTAASIPPVSIMSAEPKGPIVPGATAAAAVAGAADANAQGSQLAAPPKQLRKPAKPAAPAQAAAQPAPAPAASAASPNPVEPVWSPGATLASPGPDAGASHPQ